MEKTYAPYAKWFGSGFTKLKCAPQLQDTFLKALTAGHWEQRQTHLVSAYECVAELHNALKVTALKATNVETFFDRPFLVISLKGLAEALVGQISDKSVQEIARHTMIGSIDLVSDNTDFLCGTEHRKQLLSFYKNLSASITDPAS